MSVVLVLFVCLSSLERQIGNSHSSGGGERKPRATEVNEIFHYSLSDEVVNTLVEAESACH